jgi:CRP-like cAMP-binding protein
MSPIEQSAVRNRLLAALPPGDFAALAPALQPVKLGFKQTLHRPDRPIEAAYFPEGGMVSLLTPLEEGQTTEVGIIGREGLIGLAVVLGADSATTEAMVQMPGAALRVPASELREVFEGSAALRAVLLRYAQASHVQVAQTAACNGQHAVDERLARWMLMAHDRAEADEFPMTQEFIATMLGVRRAGISVAAGILQKAGVIRYAYGRITILDRAGLEAAACECYGAVRRQYERLLGIPAGE